MSLIESMSLATGQVVSQVALSFGTPGAYRKVTVQGIDSNLQTVAYGKIPVTRLSGGALEIERRSLLALGDASRVRGSIPQVLGWTQVSHRRLLITSPGPNGRISKRFGRRHRTFLLALADATRCGRDLGTTSFLDRLTQTISRYRSRLPPRWVSRYEDGVAVIHQLVDRYKVPAFMAHRDFSPWNVRLVSSGLFVFDWEMASRSCPPLYDFLHFHAIQAALRGGSVRWDAIVSRSGLDALWPSSGPGVKELAVAYLVDQSLHYAEARVEMPEEGDDQVWEWTGAELDRLLALA
jgi:hypothetical protein